MVTELEELRKRVDILEKMDTDIIQLMGQVTSNLLTMQNSVAQQQQTIDRLLNIIQNKLT